MWVAPEAPVLLTASELSRKLACQAWISSVEGGWQLQISFLGKSFLQTGNLHPGADTNVSCPPILQRCRAWWGGAVLHPQPGWSSVMARVGGFCKFCYFIAGKFASITHCLYVYMYMFIPWSQWCVFGTSVHDTPQYPCCQSSWPIKLKICCRIYTLERITLTAMQN